MVQYCFEPNPNVDKLYLALNALSAVLYRSMTSFCLCRKRIEGAQYHRHTHVAYTYLSSAATIFRDVVLRNHVDRVTVVRKLLLLLMLAFVCSSAASAAVGTMASGLAPA